MIKRPNIIRLRDVDCTSGNNSSTEDRYQGPNEEQLWNLTSDSLSRTISQLNSIRQKLWSATFATTRTCEFARTNAAAANSFSRTEIESWYSDGRHGWDVVHPCRVAWLRANYYNSQGDDAALKTNIPDGRSELIIVAAERIQWPTETMDTVRK